MTHPEATERTVALLSDPTEEDETEQEADVAKTMVARQRRRSSHPSRQVMQREQHNRKILGERVVCHHRNKSTFAQMFILVSKIQVFWRRGRGNTNHS